MPATRKRPPNRWKPFFLVRIYRLVRAGVDLKSVAADLGVSNRTLLNWQQKLPEVAEAVALAKKEREEDGSPLRYVYERLSPDLKKVWDDVERWEKEKNGVAKIELILADCGVRVRQTLFLHYLVAHNFSPSYAMGKLGMYKQELDDWINSDPDFARLVEEMEWHKGNLYESSLVRLVEEGVPQAVVFANKTFNRSRGYGIKTEVDLNVSASVVHGVLDLAELIPFMSEGVRAGLLEAIRKREESKPREITMKDRLSEKIAELPGE